MDEDLRDGVAGAMTALTEAVRSRARMRLGWALCMLLAACSGERPAADPPGTAGTVHEYAYVLDEAEHLLAFLRGERELVATLLADTVTLLVAPEAGVAPVRLSRGQLADRSAWRVGPYSLTPPAELPHVTMAPGLHFNCMPGDLAAKLPQLGDQPHVGVRLADAEEPTSCLRTWNVTFVFSDDAAAPRLVAVVYDQWEW
jgi:hypothetical protein